MKRFCVLILITFYLILHYDKDDVPKNAIDVLVREFLTMRMIGPHPNIVAMLGACSNDGKNRPTE